MICYYRFALRGSTPQPARKGEAVMKTTPRYTSVIILLAILLTPGLVEARTPVRHDMESQRARVAAAASVASKGGSFSSVWNLLSNWMKTGIGLDPSGSPAPSGSTGSGSSTTSDTGTQLDPSGVPH
jgi:hypothetical protein